MQTIKQEFEQIYHGKEGIYLVTFNLAQEIVCYCDPLPERPNIPTSYKGFNVRLIHSPKMSTF